MPRCTRGTIPCVGVNRVNECVPWLHPRRLLKYGESIGYPLVVAAGLLVVLGVLQVGWSNATSWAWFAGFGDHHRLEAILRFALPGLSSLGLQPLGGLWGSLAKIVSVIFIGSSVRAASRIVGRK